jgi:hypothetical protein
MRQFVRLVGLLIAGVVLAFVGIVVVAIVFGGGLGDRF